MLQIENKSLFINQMFTRIAKKYDFLNNIMTFNLHQIWKKQAIESASVNIPYLKHAKVLDLCTGTGDIVTGKHLINEDRKSTRLNSSH